MAAVLWETADRKLSDNLQPTLSPPEVRWTAPPSLALWSPLKARLPGHLEPRPAWSDPSQAELVMVLVPQSSPLCTLIGAHCALCQLGSVSQGGAMPLGVSTEAL